MRVAFAAGGLATLSAVVAAIVAPPSPAVTLAGPVSQAPTTTSALQRSVQYIQLAPGQTAPPGATVVNASSLPGTLVSQLAPPVQQPVVIRTTQSGKVLP